MKYLYVCVSSPKDNYLEQTFASIISLKKYNQKAKVTLLTDKTTENSLVNGREQIRTIVDEIIVSNLDGTLSGKERSRILKTSMRNLVSDDFLFIDGDTIILDDLSEIETFDFEFAGVLDEHLPLSLSNEYSTHKKRLEKLCSNKDFLANENFFNSGVLLIRDTPQMQDFFSLWNNEWEKSNKLGISSDQPSLALSLYKSKETIKELNGKWNCQLFFGANYYRSAKIVHYFASNGAFPFSEKMCEFIKDHYFDHNSIEFIRDNCDKILESFGPSFLCTQKHFDLMQSPCYRFLYILSFKKRIFKLIEWFLSAGRGKGFFHRIKK